MVRTSSFAFDYADVHNPVKKGLQAQSGKGGSWLTVGGGSTVSCWGERLGRIWGGGERGGRLRQIWGGGEIFVDL